MAPAHLINACWQTAMRPADLRFRRALRDPENAQLAILRRLLQRNRHSAFGRRHRFRQLNCLDDYRRAVPLRDYQEIAADIERLAAGETQVLTRDTVPMLMPTSGSQGGRKFVPLTRNLLGEFQAAIAPWMSDTFRRHPTLAGGPAYWSISPAFADAERHYGHLPICFADDSVYLGRRLAPLVARNLVTPRLEPLAPDDIDAGLDAFRQRTLLSLLACRELRFISIWHPSFLQLLLDDLPGRYDDLLRAIAEQDPARAKELAAIGPHRPQALWPRLACLSAWDQGPAATPARLLRMRFPGIAWQGKGLLATEGVVSIPYGGCHPAALCSHLLEFEDDSGRCHLAHELRTGASYRVVLTTGAGFYRYRLRDRVMVDGFLARCPSLRFLGRDDAVCDLHGEKLDPVFVQQVLDRCLSDHRPAPSLAMLVPTEQRDGYRCLLAADACSDDLAAAIDTALCDNPHYRLCRQLGQLRPLRLDPVGEDAAQRYLHARCADGIQLGDIKIPALAVECDWIAV